MCQHDVTVNEQSHGINSLNYHLNVTKFFNLYFFFYRRNFHVARRSGLSAWSSKLLQNGSEYSDTSIAPLDAPETTVIAMCSEMMKREEWLSVISLGMESIWKKL